MVIKLGLIVSKLIVSLRVTIWELVDGPKEKAWYTLLCLFGRGLGGGKDRVSYNPA